MSRFFLRPCLLALGLAVIFAFPARADIGTEEFLRDQERQRQLRERLLPDAEVRFPRKTPGASGFQLPLSESPCFSVNALVLDGEHADRFRPVLATLLEESGFVPGMCLGGNGINFIMSRLQDQVIADGYVTTRIVAQAQNIAQEQKIVLLIIPGKIRHLRFDGGDAQENSYSNVKRMQYFRNEFPMEEGDWLNLRDIETALENFRRLSSVEAEFEIVPGDIPGESDIVIRWRQKFPLRLTLSADDSGSRQTGKNQGTVAVSLENPLGLSDILYGYYSHDLGYKKRHRDPMTGQKRVSGTEGYGFHYSVPFANWTLAYNYGYSKYEQAVAGFFTDYLYWGTSHTHDLGLTRILYRDGSRKTSAEAGLWFRSGRNYIDDAELTIQRRRTAGWRMEVAHTEYIDDATLYARARYKQGTGLLHSLRAPEEDFDEGTSRMRLINADLSLAWPFSLAKERFAFNSQAHFQHNLTPLVAQDKLSIGGRHTVRGFDGEITLMAERGYYWRNELAWHYAPGHQLYALWDRGQVRGPSAQWLAGTLLEGAGMGVRGQFNGAGNWFYDLSVSRPVKAPKLLFSSHGVIAAMISLTF
ncbi:MAG: ShlB/FhaC/HecB family hemolysin secretion/activation protein [Zoogloeaceae bacterium]|jgi:hemolysin activation/secretion protein|nr:ShlB/FhaC/HecB family hemolysin secretion/activation protein [Zoogloeaceae bacterium]